ncbi:MAG: DUF2808 domain-containing protein [Cyanobacteria bacterium J06621_8]
MFKNINSIGSTLFSSATLILMNSIPVPAIEAPDGTVSFESGIDLLDTYTTFKGIRVRQARYYFDLRLPEGIGEPLKKVVIQQRTGGERIDFRPEQTKAYLNLSRRKEDLIELTTTFNEETREVTVEFSQPVPIGSSLSIGIKPRQNPDLGGVYLFGVTAFPRGEKSRGLYLGPGRIHILDNFNSFLIHPEYPSSLDKLILEDSSNSGIHIVLN